MSTEGIAYVEVGLNSENSFLPIFQEPFGEHEHSVPSFGGMLIEWKLRRAGNCLKETMVISHE